MMIILLATMAHTAPAAQPQTTPAPSAPAATAEQSPAPVYSYNPQGRRDPFVSLVGRGNDPRRSTERAAGLPGLLVNEATVKGIMRDHAGFIAMIQAPDNRTYIVRAGDKLADGAIKAITADTVVFAQDVNDPLSLVKQREVPKRLRTS
jgi:type IV pilus assembly protein PilP